MGDVQFRGISDPGSRCILAGENGPGVNGLALGIDKGKGLVKRLWRGKPLKSRGGRRRFRDDQELGVVRKRHNQRLPQNSVG